MWRVWPLLCILLWRTCHVNGGSSRGESSLASKVKQWRRLANDSFDPHRKTQLATILQKQAGIYVDPTHSINDLHVNADILEKSVVVLTIEALPKALLSRLAANAKPSPYLEKIQQHHAESDDKEDRLERYMQFLFNLLCYFKQHQLKALLFVNCQLPASSDQPQQRIDTQAHLLDAFREYIQSIYKHVDVVNYSDSLFWSFIARKTKSVEAGRGKADYEGSEIRYQHFGALPMLIPTFELISLGYHVVYFDVDMVFLEDPIPHLLHNADSVDIVVSPELRTCEYPSFAYDIQWSLHMEANTGIMFVKSSPHSIRYVDGWLLRNVEKNVHNDQRVMSLHAFEGSSWTKDCDRHFDSQVDVRRQERPPSDSTTLRYCFTSEFQFYNGYMEFFCHQHRHNPRSLNERDMHRSIFDYTMFYFGNKKGLLEEPRAGNLSATELLAALNSSVFIPSSTSSGSGGKTEGIFFYPVVLHVNYCDHKRKELENRGLWLLQQTHASNASTSPPSAQYQCKTFNLYKTEYANMDFSTKLTLARAELEDMLARKFLVHDNLLRWSQRLLANDPMLKTTAPPPRSPWMIYYFKFLPGFYYYDDGYLRPVSDMSTVLQLGKDANVDVSRLSRKFHQIVPYGKPVALDADIEHLTCAAQQYRHQHQALPVFLQQHLQHNAAVINKLNLKDRRLLPLQDAGQPANTPSNNSPHDHMIPLPLLKLQQDALKLSQAFTHADRWQNLQTFLGRVTQMQLERFHNQSMHSGIANQPSVQQAYDTFYSRTVFIHILNVQTHTSLYQELLQNYICSAKAHDFILVIYLLELDPQRFEEHAKAITALSEHIHVLDFPYALYWKMVGQKAMQSLGPVHFKFIDVNFKNVGFVLMIIPMLEIIQLGFQVFYLDLDIGVVRDPVPYLVHSEAELILSAELRTCHFDSILFDAKASMKVSELNTGMLFAKANANTLRLFDEWILAIINQGIVNDQKALRIGDLGGLPVFDCNPQLPSEVAHKSLSSVAQQVSSFVKLLSSNNNNNNKQATKSIKFCVLNDLLFQNGRVSQCGINKEGSQAEYSLAMVGTAVLDTFFGPQQSYAPRYDVGDKELAQARTDIANLLLQEMRNNTFPSFPASNRNTPSGSFLYLHPNIPLPTFPFLLKAVQIMQSQLSKMRILPVAVHANYCDHKKPWLEEKGMWLVKSFDPQRPCLRCLKLKTDQTWFARHNWVEAVQLALKELHDLRNLPIHSVVKISKQRDIFLVTNDSFRPFENGEVFLAKGFQWDNIQKIPHQYFYFLDRGIGAVVTNQTVIA